MHSSNQIYLNNSKMAPTAIQTTNHSVNATNAKKAIPVWKDCAMQIAAGGSAGFIEICIMHPLDVVKTRLQFQRGFSQSNYTSVMDCFRKMIASEGFFSIYKGILPPILAETPKRATKFFTFEQYKHLFSFGAAHPSAYVCLKLKF